MQTTSDRVVVIREKAAIKTEGGVLLAESAIKPANKGKVLMVGPDCKSAKEGDTILFSVTGTELEHEGKVLTIIRENGIDLIL